MDGLVPPAARTKTHLSANRRRFRREGVALIGGEPTDLYPLRVTARRPITVRPAYRPAPRRPKAELIAEAVFNRLEWPLLGATAILTLALAAFQIFR